MGARLSRRDLLLLAGATALPAAGCTAKPAPWPPVPSGPAPAVTAGGGPAPFTPGRVMLGGYVDLRGMTAAESLRLRRRQLGRDLRIVHRYYSWTDRLPATLAYLPAGSTLMLSWRGPTLREITGGGADRLITAAARRLAAGRRPILLRWGWDMNRDFFRWGGAANGRSPEGYVTAWRRLRRLFREAGADNVAWVWSPNADTQPDEDWNRIDGYYPGDEHVDWVGVSGYARQETPAQMFDEVYQRYSARKPIMIAEVAVADRGGASKPDWITDFAAWVRLRPAVGAAVWFDTDTHPGSAENWRIDSDPNSLAAYRALATEPVFGG
ncbi:glycoside hydrolase family 26 protein [Actinoplanes teichomyceticus]|uniref:Glycosyl hydrolase family 26 n=1 Tax=Actinoplanes teichomyceticus TaxID=1867 RepID=A0A561WM55_ACTTI|nr:glycosyl hydrolase [Actinoplanes teichomyceticus]TWG24935.1 glycosyl hydrolase family 26 [Actinoplanes teichomyceticus]GIF15528.1 hypothetical protein Ate01nite_55600 [Actinoplanes teichomyceticus]